MAACPRCGADTPAAARVWPRCGSTLVDAAEVVARDRAPAQAFVRGAAVNVAKRLEGAAAAGEVVIGVVTQRLVRDAALVEPVENLELKGKAEPISVWRLLAVVKGAPAFT